LRFEPTFKILNANLVLNLWVRDRNRNRCLTAAHLVDPIVLTKHTKALSYRLIERVRGNLDGVLNTSRVAVRDLALTKAHSLSLSYSPFIRHLFAMWNKSFVQLIFPPAKRGVRYFFSVLFDD
jgi:hypothetical protein